MSLTMLLRGVIGLGAALVLVPTIVLCARPNWIRAWFEAGPDGIDKLASQAARQLIAALRELGFEPLGVKVEKPPLRRLLRDFSFVASDRQCYASVADTPAGARMYFFTP